MVVEGKSGGKSDKMEIVKVTGAIITSKNQFLICRRGPNEIAAGFWEFPGGKIEKNETEKECIKRELKEELNINAVVGNLYDQYLYKSTNVAYNLSFFITKVMPNLFEVISLITSFILDFSFTFGIGFLEARSFNVKFNFFPKDPPG